MIQSIDVPLLRRPASLKSVGLLSGLLQAGYALLKFWQVVIHFDPRRLVLKPDVRFGIDDRGIIKARRSDVDVGDPILMPVRNRGAAGGTMPPCYTGR